MGSWRDFTFHFHLISCCAIPSVWLSGAGPLPQRTHLILFCKHAIPTVWHTFGIKTLIHFSCMFEPASAWVSQAIAATCYLVLSGVPITSTCLDRACKVLDFPVTGPDPRDLRSDPKTGCGQVIRSGVTHSDHLHRMWMRCWIILIIALILFGCDSAGPSA